MGYIPISNRPLKYIFQYGGSLTEEERKDYFWRCKNLKCSTNPNEFKDSLKQNLKILQDLVREKIEKTYADVKASGDKEKLSKIEELSDLFKVFLGEEFKNTNLSHNNNGDRPEDIVTLHRYNAKSLQLVILLDHLFYIMNPNWQSQYPIKSAVLAYKKYITDDDTKDRWKNINALMQDMNIQYDPWNVEYKKSRGLYVPPVPLRGTESLIRVKTKYGSEKYCCPLQDRARILVSLGEMTLAELIESMIDGIFLIGIVDDLSWADGNQYTPYEFVHHDLTHTSNYETYGGKFTPLSKEVKQFIKQLITHQKSIDPATFDTIMLVLFMFIHESGDFFLLNKPFSEAKPLFHSFEFSPFIYDITNWKNPYLYGGLLPKDKLNLSDSDLDKYLIEKFETFRQIWNRILQEKDISFLFKKEPVIPSVGRNSAFFVNQDGGRRHKKRKTRRHQRKKKTRRQSSR